MKVRHLLVILVVALLGFVVDSPAHAGKRLKIKVNPFGDFMTIRVPVTNYSEQLITAPDYAPDREYCSAGYIGPDSMPMYSVGYLRLDTTIGQYSDSPFTNPPPPGQLITTFYFHLLGYTDY